MRTLKNWKVGIVSEIRVGTLIKSDNKYIKTPCRVVVHVMERTTDGGINICTVNMGVGAFITAGRAEFMELSEVLPVKYQELTPADCRAIIEDEMTIKQKT